MHATLQDFQNHVRQIARLAADPLLSLWVSEEATEAYVAAELERLDPASARISEAEADWLRRVHAVNLRNLV